MARASIPEVRAILPSSTSLTDAQITANLTAASLLIDEIAAGCASGLSDSMLKQIEIYTAAHFAAVTENTLSIQSEKDACTDASVTYGFKFGEGIKGTPFGITANLLSGGCLAEMDKPPARFYSIGSA